MVKLLLVDNFDSFTFMLADRLMSVGAAVDVVRADRISAREATDADVDGIVISPGPGHPADAGPSVAIAEACLSRRRPYLGICLGHQALALACGSAVRRVDPVHGKVARVRHDGTGLFGGLASPLEMTRYHSLAVPEPVAPLIANAWSDDGLVMGVRHASAPAHGLQFHPESIASPHGPDLLSAFVERIRNNA